MKVFRRWDSPIYQKTEKEFRKFYFRNELRQLLIGIVCWSAFNLFAIYQDSLALGITADFYWLALLRIGYTLLALVIAWLGLFHVRRHTSLDWLSFLWATASVLVTLTGYQMNRANDPGLFLIDFVAILSLYVFVPGFLPARVAPALALTLFEFQHAWANQPFYTAETVSAVFFSFSILNIICIFCCILTISSRRAQFISRKQDRGVQIELQRLASTDVLTGIYNRRKLLDLASEAFYRFRRYNRPFTLLIMDLDGFKQVNDTFGHQQGDQTLVEFAQMILQEKREGDHLGRMGGDEFCLLLPETNSGEAMHVAERILTRCKDLSFNRSRALVMRVTVSIGIAEVSSKDRSVDSLYARGDAALYESKNLGKDRIVLSSGSAAVGLV